MTFRPELLSPAGTLRNMRYAFAYGADAVYAGQPRYSLRVRNNDFTLANLEQGIREAHEQGKHFYVASNIAPHNAKIKTYMRDIEPVIEMKPDALIMSDPGLIMMVRDRFPDQTIHLSVQANVVNYASAEFWYRQGIKRIILSRELSLEEIATIRSNCPGDPRPAGGPLRREERPRRPGHPLLLRLRPVQDRRGGPADLLPLQAGPHPGRAL